MNFTREFNCYVGKKGSGKTFTMMDDASQVIVATNMQIVLNLPVYWGPWAEYLKGKFDWEGNLLERCTVLTEREHVRRFWYFWGQGWVVPWVDEKEWKRGRRPDFRFAYRWLPTIEDIRSRLDIWDMAMSEINAEVDRGTLERIATSKLPGVAYFIDEIGTYYSAREDHEWIPGLDFYLDQQRKLRHEIVASTVRVNKISKAVRDMIDNWHVCQNWGKRRKGWFRMPSVLTVAHFDSEPGRQGVEAEYLSKRTLDVAGLCTTYDTSAGVGIEGNVEADKGTKAKGLHWSFVLVFIALAVVLALGGIKGLRWGANRLLAFVGLSREQPKVVQPGPGAATNLIKSELSPTNLGNVSGELLGLPKVAGHEKAKGHREEEKHLTGIQVWLGRPIAYFSDGSSLSQEDAEWGRLLRRGGKFQGLQLRNGKSYWLGEGQEKENRGYWSPGF